MCVNVCERDRERERERVCIIPFLKPGFFGVLESFFGGGGALPFGGLWVPEVDGWGPWGFFFRGPWGFFFRGHEGWKRSTSGPDMGPISMSEGGG